MSTSRRSVITGLVSLIAAPAIVRASSLMPVRAWLPDTAAAAAAALFPAATLGTFEPNELVCTYLENGVLLVRRCRPEEWRAALDGP